MFAITRGDFNRQMSFAIGSVLFFFSMFRTWADEDVYEACGRFLKQNVCTPTPSSSCSSTCYPACLTLGHGYLGATVGASFAKVGNSDPQISYESGVLITDAYPLNKKRSLAVMLSVNGGYEFTGENWKPAIALGLGAYFTPQDFHFKGQLIETPAGSASSTLYNYKYKIHNTRALAEIQLTWTLAYISPFINFGMGTAWNAVKHYTETAISDTDYPPLLPFHSRTHCNFAYQAGIGISTDFNWGNCADFQRERISVGYHYVNSGRTSFGTRGSSYPYPLHTGTLSSNDVYFSYIHLF